LAADVVGYSGLTEINETGTHQRLKRHWAEVFQPKISDHQGKIFQTAGDGILAEFSSVVDALECAIDIQRYLASRKIEESGDQSLIWRMGINLGDVIVDGNDLYGDGVNIAVRLEGLAEPGGICISEAVFTQTRNKVDVVCESLGNQKVKNIAEPVHVYRVEIRANNGEILGRGGWNYSSGSILDKPSIAVLPFANMTANQDKQYLVDGLVEDLITGLTRFPQFFVAARTSSFAYRDKQFDARELARRLRVNYVIEGSMQQDKERMRITVQLIESESGSHLWVGRYDRINTDLFDVRDEITNSVAGTLMTISGGVLPKAELARRARKAPENFTVYDHYLRGRDFFHRSIIPPWQEGKELSALAKVEFTKAIENSAPPYWPAYAGLAWQYAIDFDWGYAPDAKQSAELAFKNASIAVKNSPDDYLSHWILGWAYLFAKHDHERAITQYEIAYAMNPADSRMLAEMAQPLIYADHSGQAIAKLKYAIRLNPIHEQWYDEFLGWAYEENGQPGMAIETLNKLGELEGIWSYAVLALAYVQTGQFEKFKDQIIIIDSMTHDQFNEKFSSKFWREWVQSRDPYKESTGAERVIQTMASALKRIGVED
jgi:adenylate cyclase